MQYKYKTYLKPKKEYYKEVLISTLQLYSITLILPVTILIAILMYSFSGSLQIPLIDSLTKLFMTFYGNPSAQKAQVLLFVASAIYSLFTIKMEIIKSIK